MREPRDSPQWRFHVAAFVGPRPPCKLNSSNSGDHKRSNNPGWWTRFHVQTQTGRCASHLIPLPSDDVGLRNCSGSWTTDPESRAASGTPTGG
eukprot:3929811-Karenia_brevis.AAC.1